jgi:plasmid stabilization system protein ParE
VTWREVWTDNAISGVREIGMFQEELDPGKGKVIVNAIFDRVTEQLEFPEAAPVHPKAGDMRVRRLVFRRYVIIYRLLAEQGVFEVLSVRHQRQRPAELDELP